MLGSSVIFLVLSSFQDLWDVKDAGNNSPPNGQQNSVSPERDRTYGRKVKAERGEKHFSI